MTAFVRAGHRVVVAFPHRGEALRTENLLRRVDAPLLEPGRRAVGGAAGALRRFAGAPRLRLARPDLVLLPDTQLFRKRAPRPDTARIGRALQSFADLRTGDYVVHEDHGIGKLLGFETKAVAGVTRDYLLLAFRGDDRLYVPHEQIGKVSRYIGADAAPVVVEARRQGMAEPQDTRAHVRPRARGRAARALRAAAAGAGPRLRPRHDGCSGWRRSSPTARRRTRSARSRR